MATKFDIQKDPRVQGVRNDFKGRLVAILLPGFVNDLTGAHFIVEDDLDDTYTQIKNTVRKCDCRKCDAMHRLRNSPAFVQATAGVFASPITYDDLIEVWQRMQGIAGAFEPVRPSGLPFGYPFSHQIVKANPYTNGNKN